MEKHNIPNILKGIFNKNQFSWDSLISAQWLKQEAPTGLASSSHKFDIGASDSETPKFSQMYITSLPARQLYFNHCPYFTNGVIFAMFAVVVVTAYDFESDRPVSNPEWESVYYKASIAAHGLPEPSSLRGSTLGTRAAEHKGYNWACKLTDSCSLKRCVRLHPQWHVRQK